MVFLESWCSEIFTDPKGNREVGETCGWNYSDPQAPRTSAVKTRSHICPRVRGRESPVPSAVLRRGMCFINPCWMNDLFTIYRLCYIHWNSRLWVNLLIPINVKKHIYRIYILVNIIHNHVVVAQSSLTLRDPMGYSLPGSSVHGILQARILEWVAISFCNSQS